ncbi:hypothetical protein C7W88_12950 [Novosphingobium sp. THN1]|uniref:hypothetical protein n=1 Tax=Novosphingobium sp. THN1 TaxID=1016987 RepID=UPI000E544C51|nr:hypothetical protein [Novosphingobium sp. THN1]AXU19729.1 hypothetical protein C7W88_12950 [Novosphingobium sp. THN1]
MIDEALWHDPDQPYTGPVDADLSAHPDPFGAAAAIFAFTTEAQTCNRAAMRQRWPEYRGKVPPDLAKTIIDDIEARGATCSKP